MRPIWSSRFSSTKYPLPSAQQLPSERAFPFLDGRAEGLLSMEEHKPECGVTVIERLPPTELQRRFALLQEPWGRYSW